MLSPHCLTAFHFSWWVKDTCPCCCRVTRLIGRDYPRTMFACAHLDPWPSPKACPVNTCLLYKSCQTTECSHQRPPLLTPANGFIDVVCSGHPRPCHPIKEVAWVLSFSLGPLPKFSLRETLGGTLWPFSQGGGDRNPPPAGGQTNNNNYCKYVCSCNGRWKYIEQSQTPGDTESESLLASGWLRGESRWCKNIDILW